MSSFCRVRGEIDAVSLSEMKCGTAQFDLMLPTTEVKSPAAGLYPRSTKQEALQSTTKIMVDVNYIHV